MFKFYTDVVDIIKHFFQMEKLLFGSVDNAKKKRNRKFFLQFFTVVFLNAVDSAKADVISIDSVEEVGCWEFVARLSGKSIER